MLEITSSPETVLQPDEKIGWMSRSAAFQKVVQDKIFFCGESLSGQWHIAVADFDEGVPSEPRLVEIKSEWRFAETITPNAIKTSDGFVLAFAGRRASNESRRVFVARSSTLDGPWEVEGRPYTPSEAWEGRNVDLGPGNMLENDSMMFFYSSAYPRFRQVARSFLRRPHFPSEQNFMRYEKRRIGILKVSANEPRVISGRREPIPLNCPPGTPFESVFCPGYTVLDKLHLFFMACSNYSMGYPFEQLIGVVESDSSPANWRTTQEIRAAITSGDLPPPLSSHTAFDTPDPVPLGQDRVMLYFSAMSRDLQRWSIMACELKAT